MTLTRMIAYMVSPIERILKVYGKNNHTGLHAPRRRIRKRLLFYGRGHLVPLQEPGRGGRRVHRGLSWPVDGCPRASAVCGFRDRHGRGLSAGRKALVEEGEVRNVL